MGRRSRTPVALRLLCGLGALVLLALPRTVRAQDVVCDPGEPEIRALEFEGNRAFTDDELVIRVATTASDRQRRLFRLTGTRRCLNRTQFVRDRIQLIAFYRQRGFYDVQVDTLVRPAPRGAVDIVFRIAEGEPLMLDSVRIAGLERVPERASVLAGLALRPGVPFDRTQIAAAVDTIVRRLRNTGYPRVEVLPGYDTDIEARRATVDLTVLPGPRATIGAVRIQVEPMPGKPREWSDADVRRLLEVERGDLFRARELEEAQRRLYQSNAFRSVEVAIAADSGSGRDSLVSLEVRLREDFQRQVDNEWGWGTLDCFRTRAQYTDKNFIGGARRLELTGQVSKIGYGYPLGFAPGFCFPDIQRDVYSDTLNYYVGGTLRAPRLLNTEFIPALSVYRERRGEFLAYLRTTLIGADASLIRDIRPRIPLRLGYTLEYGRTQAQPAFLCAIFNRCTEQEQEQISVRALPLATLGASLARVRVDQPLFPRRGSIQRFEVRTSSQLLGSDRSLEFTRGIADFSFYQPVGGRGVFAMRVRGGVVLNSRFEVGQGEGAFVPPQERLYAGGATSVRGFQQNELGALVYIAESYVDSVLANGDTVFVTPDGVRPRRFVPAGGDALLVGNFELRVRDPFLPDLVQYTLFADAGEVWSRGDTTAIFGFRRLRWTPGLGVRVFTPVGPIQVNVAYNPYARPAGPVYFDTPAAGSSGVAPLYCVSPGNRFPIVRDPGTGTRVQQGNGAACPSTFTPPTPAAFIRRLTFTFSIGPDF